VSEIEVGSVLDGKVTGITKFGAFVALPGGKSGLVHISEIAYSYVSEVSEHLHEGQDVKVKVIGIDPARRINLSIKQVAPPPPRPPRPAPPRGDGPRPSGGQSRGGGNNRSYQSSGRQTGYVRPAPKEPTDFEDRLKQFMQSSDSKLSELRYIEKKGGNRRGGGNRR
jgi:S1 RNA binding domain protein